MSAPLVELWRDEYEHQDRAWWEQALSLSCVYAGGEMWVDLKRLTFADWEEECRWLASTEEYTP